MKTTFPRLIILLALLAMLVPSCAFAITGQELAALRGQRSYPQALDLPDAQTMASDGIMLLSGENTFPQPDEQEIRALTEQYKKQLTDLGSAVDFLSVFTDDYAGALVNQANHLQSMYLIAEASLSGTEKDMVGEFITQYSQIASSLYSEVEFLTTKLSYAYERIDVLIRLIQSGEYAPAEIDAYVAELSSVAGEAEERLNTFLTDEDYLYAYFYRFFEASLMISGMTDGMNLQLSTLHEASEAVLRAQAQALYEQENGGGLLRAASTPIAVVSRNQYVIVARDENHSPIEGAEIMVRVLDGNSKVIATLGGKTDSYGYEIFCFDDFRPGSDDKASIDVIIRAKGYRTQASGKLYVRGGGFTEMSLTPDSDSSPYIIQATYNHEDIERVANGIYITPYNHANQRLCFTVNTTVPCRVQLYQPASADDPSSKENIVAEFSVDPQNPDSSVQQDKTFTTEYTRVFHGEYGSDAYFKRSLPVYTRVIWNQGGSEQKRETLTPFSVKKARVPNPSSVNDANVFMNKVGFKLPNDWPILGGSTFSLPTNAKNAHYFFFLGLDGTLYAGAAKTFSIKKLSWQNTSAKHQQAMDESIAADNLGRIRSFQAGVAGNYDMMQLEHVVAGYSTTITPYLCLIARRSSIDADDFDTEGWYEYQGDITIGAIAAFKASTTFQGTFGPVPVFMTLDFSMGFNLGFQAGFKLDMKGYFGGFREFTWSDNTGFTFSFFLDVSITAGAGIPRFAYVGIFGRAYAEGNVVFAPRPSLRQGRAFASVSVDVCIFFYRKLFTLWSVEASLTNGDALQRSLVLSSMEEGVKNARASSSLMAVSAGPSVNQTDLTEKTTVRAVQDIMAESSNVHFLPVSMKNPFSRRGEITSSVPDIGLTLWLEKDAAGRQRIHYSSTALSTDNDLSGAGSRTIELSSGYDGYSVVDFDVKYFCVPKREGRAYPATLYFAMTIAPTGTPEDKVAANSKLLIMQSVILAEQNGAGSYHVVLDNNYQREITYDGGPVGITMPRIERTYLGIVIGAIGVFEDSGRKRSAVLLYDSHEDSFSRPAWTVAQWLDKNPGEGWEIAEFDLLDRPFKVGISGSEIFKPGYVLLMRSTTDESQSRFCFYPGSVKSWKPGMIPADIAVCYIGGKDLPNFSNIHLIEEVDELYNTRQVGIGALRLLRDEQSQNLYTNLFLMTLDSNMDKGSDVWLHLKPTDTGVTVSADGLRFLEINGSYYAYWLSSSYNQDHSKIYEIKASYISLENGLASQPFTLLNLYQNPDGETKDHIARANLFPLTRGSGQISQSLLYGAYLGKNTADETGFRWAKFSYGIQMGMELTALVPQAPVIVPGDTFTSFIKVRNTGMLPIYNFSIDYLTRPAGSAAGSNVFVKQIAVDMQNLSGNEVRNVNQNTGAVTSVALRGESAVYRVDDGSRERNGEIAHTKVYYPHFEINYTTGGYMDSGYDEKTIEVASLPADGTLELKTSFTAPLNCWGDLKKRANVILTARVHNLETGTDMVPQSDTAVYASERGGAVTLNAPLSAQNDEGQSAESDNDFGQKLTLPASAVYYASTDLSGKRIDTADFDLAGNDLILEADVAMVGGVPTVQITLRNLDGTQAENVVPMLVAMVDGKETWRLSLKSPLTNGFTRSLSVPLAELADGQPYSSIDLYLVESSSKRKLTENSLDYASFGEANGFDNYRRLYPVYDFYFRTEPQSTTAFVGADVTLTAEAAGESGPFTYQWYELAPDGTQRTLRGETGTSLTLKKLTLSSDNTKYLCSATNSQGVVLYSHVATLTVSEELPVTGDTSRPIAWLALLGLSGLVLLLLIVRRRSSK